MSMRTSVGPSRMDEALPLWLWRWLLPNKASKQIFRRAVLTTPLGGHLPCNPRLFAFSPPSKFDARQKPNCRRLNATGRAENPVRITRIEVGHGVCLEEAGRVISKAVAANLTSRECPVTSHSLHCAKANISRDVRARKSVRFSRDLKGEPSFRKMGLPLAASSIAGDRVPLRPRKAVEHPDTSGTVRDVRAPGAHDGASGFEKVRPLIGPRNLGANHV